MYSEQKVIFIHLPQDYLNHLNLYIMKELLKSLDINFYIFNTKQTQKKEKNGNTN